MLAVLAAGVVTVPGFCNSVDIIGFLTCHRSDGGDSGGDGKCHSVLKQ